MFVSCFPPTDQNIWRPLTSNHRDSSTFTTFFFVPELQLNSCEIRKHSFFAVICFGSCFQTSSCKSQRRIRKDVFGGWWIKTTWQRPAEICCEEDEEKNGVSSSQIWRISAGCVVCASPNVPEVKRGGRRPHRAKWALGHRRRFSLMALSSVVKATEYFHPTLSKPCHSSIESHRAFVSPLPPQSSIAGQTPSTRNSSSSNTLIHF